MTANVQMFKVGDSEDAEECGYLSSAGIDRVWYHYKTQPYEGYGVAVFQRADKWNETDLGHCSCYGPWHRLPTKESDVDTLDVLEAKCSTDYHAQLAPIFAAARAAQGPA